MDNDNGLISLHYDNYSKAMVETLIDLFRSNSLVDCVLAAEGQCLKAHRVILAASSPYFQMLFSQENERLPIVFLKDVEYEHLKMILHFIYHGEIKLKNNQLQPFLEVAKSLQIKGLDARGRKNNSEFGSSQSLEPNQKELQVSSPSVVTSIKQNKGGHEDKEQEGEEEEEEVEERHTADCDVKSVISALEGGPLEDIDSASVQTEIYTEALRDLVDQSSSFTNQSSCSLSPSEGALITDLTDDPEDTASHRSISPNEDGTYVTLYSPKVIMENFNKVFEDEGIRIEEITIDENLPDDSIEDITKSSKDVRCTCSVQSSLPYNDDAMEEGPGGTSIQARENKTQVSVNNESESHKRKAICHGDEGRVKLQHQETMDSNSEAFSSLQESGANVLGEEAGPTSQCGPEQHLPVTTIDDLAEAARPEKVPRKLPKRHRCPICTKAFVTPADLQRHIRIHTGERPYKCTECSKSFKIRGEFVNHQYVHTGNWPYVCRFCQSGFAKKCLLETHIRLHTGERPFLCPECGKGFREKSAVYKHMRSVHRLHCRLRSVS